MEQSHIQKTTDEFFEALARDERLLSEKERILIANIIKHATANSASAEVDKIIMSTINSAIEKAITERILGSVGRIIINNISSHLDPSLSTSSPLHLIPPPPHIPPPHIDPPPHIPPPHIDPPPHIPPPHIDPPPHIPPPHIDPPPPIPPGSEPATPPTTPGSQPGTPPTTPGSQPDVNYSFKEVLPDRIIKPGKSAKITDFEQLDV